MTNPDNIVRVRARNGGRASVYEANGWGQAYSSGLLEGNGVVQNTVADMNVLVGGSTTKPDVVLAENPAGYRIGLDLVGQQPIAITAPATNSRISAIVAYTDDLSLESTEDTITGSPASCGLIVVNGTAGAEPSEPTDAQIRTAITADGATGSQAAYAIIATIEVASDTTIITDSLININQAAIPSSKLDWTTMKRWVPDYANRSSVNLWANTTSTTITEAGFVTCVVNSYRVDQISRSYIYANGKEVVVDSAEARAPNTAVISGASAVLPVSPGDVISCGTSSGGSYNIKNCYFMPGKWV